MSHSNNLWAQQFNGLVYQNVSEKNQAVNMFIEIETMFEMSESCIRPTLNNLAERWKGWNNGSVNSCNFIACHPPNWV